MRRKKSLFERMENHAIYNVKSPRKKRKPQLTESQIPTFNYLKGIRESVANRMRFTR